MNCPNCATEIPDGSKFCNECGSSVSSAGVAATPADSPNPGTLDVGQTIAPPAAQPSPAPSSLDDGMTIAPESQQPASTQAAATGYEILEPLGEGGMGVVFKARDTKLNRIVALKRLQTNLVGSDAAIQRFLTEAQTIASLNHYNIVHIYDIDHDAQGHYISMEYVDGESLAERIRRDGALPEDQALAMMKQLLAALSHAHKQGVIHRDIKPSNVLLTNQGDPKLVDFGLARMGEQSELTMRGSSMGTVAYASPEQLSDASRVDGRADVYSMGATFYQMLTGESPLDFSEDKLPDALRGAVTKAMGRDREQRWQSAAEFLDALTAVSESRGFRVSTRTDGNVVENGDCPKCGRRNGQEPRFCRGCGANLYEPCLVCGKPTATGFRYCEKCGGDQEAVLNKGLEDLTARVSSAHEEAKWGWTGEETKAVEEAANQKPYMLADLPTRAKEVLVELEQLRQEGEGRRQALEQQAQELMGKGDYGAVFEALDAVPPNIRDSVPMLGEPWQWASRVSELTRGVQQGLRDAQPYDLLRSDLHARFSGWLGELQSLGAGAAAELKAELVAAVKTEQRRLQELTGRVGASRGNGDYRGVEDELKRVPTFLVEATAELTSTGDWAQKVDARVRELVKEAEESLSQAEPYVLRDENPDKLYDHLRSLADELRSLDPSKGKPVAGELTRLRAADEERCDRLIARVGVFQKRAEYASVLDAVSGVPAFLVDGRVELAAAREWAQATRERVRSLVVEAEKCLSRGWHDSLPDARGATPHSRFGALLGEVTPLDADAALGLRAKAEAERTSHLDRAKELQRSRRYGAALDHVRKAAELPGLSEVAVALEREIEAERRRRRMLRAGAVAASLVVLACAAILLHRRAVCAAKQRDDQAYEFLVDHVGSLRSKAETPKGAIESRLKAYTDAQALCDEFSGKRPHSAHLTEVAAETGRLATEAKSLIAAEYVRSMEAARAAFDSQNLSLTSVHLSAALWLKPDDGAAKKLESQIPEAEYARSMRAAQSAYERGELPKAAEHVQRALELKPHGPEATQLQARIVPVLVVSAVPKGAVLHGLSPDVRADVYTDTRKVGTTPLRWPMEKGKRYEVRVAKVGFRSWSETVVAPVAGEKRFELELEERGLPHGFDQAFLLPEGDRDQYGNPVVRRDGSEDDSATGYPYEIWLKEPRMEFVLVPAGEFMMGSPEGEDRRDSDEQQHPVRLSRPFYLAKYEITQAQWSAMTSNSPWAGRSCVKPEGRNPAVYISWDDCQGFLKELGSGFRLPTEAEWEYACRAGSAMAYCFGDSESGSKDYAWYEANAGGFDKQYAHGVGQKRPNAWGLYDMHGNVWEWCEDWHGDYPSGSVTDPTGPSRGSSRVYRGGCFGGSPRVALGGGFFYSADICRSANRDCGSPGRRDGVLGFRPSRSLP